MVRGCRLDVIGHNGGYDHAGVQATGSFYMYTGVNTTFGKCKFLIGQLTWNCCTHMECGHKSLIIFSLQEKTGSYSKGIIQIYSYLVSRWTNICPWFHVHSIRQEQHSQKWRVMQCDWQNIWVLNSGQCHHVLVMEYLSCSVEWPAWHLIVLYVGKKRQLVIN